jgi:ATPase subunit of ABC transporter with duplicated ATPase domains
LLHIGIQANDMQQSIGRSRLLDEVLLRLRESPVVVLLGARQVGKTTLAGQVAERMGGATLFDLERATGRAALSATPELTLTDAQGLVVIDEVQRLPASSPPAPAPSTTTATCSRAPSWRELGGLWPRAGVDPLWRI